MASAATAVSAATNNLSATAGVISRSAASTNREFFRLTNTPKTLGELTTSPRAILLENALIDTAANLSLKIPAHLRAAGEPGAYIVQARGLVDAAFRTALADAGAQMVSYIPNNAYLVQLSAAGAAALAGNAEVQAVLPYEPYFKLQSSLLGQAAEQKSLPPGQVLTLGLFASGADATVAQIEKMGGTVLGTDRSPFGPVVRVQPPVDWMALAQLPGVQRVEPAHRRVPANDLSRAITGVAPTSVAQTNYLNLYGSNVLVEVNDTGVDTNHPDLQRRVLLSFPDSGVDTDGHGTFVAGEIAGSGFESMTVTNAQGSIMPGTNVQFRGKAPAANLYSVGFLGANDTNVFVDDSYLQAAPALTNALISNNSWVNDGANEYDLSAASYDAAVRDALPEVTGPQPVLFVFAAGNDGGGNNDGAGGNSDSIVSPGTAKDVITVGSLEEFRNITNTYLPLGSTNPDAVWAPQTDSPSQVAGYSARGNVGIGTEGTYGRFKPDVVTPGTFVISTRSTEWATAAYYNPTNYHVNAENTQQIIDTNISDFGFYQMTIPTNAVGVILTAVPNNLSPTPFPVLEFCLTATNGAGLDPTDPTSYDFAKTNNTVTIPLDGGAGYLQQLVAGGSLSFAVVDTTNIPVDFDLVEEIITTNDNGNYELVLSNLNDTIGPWYRYETGTSMAAADVSGVLALMQDYFTNTLHTTPSPALLKAMLINGARVSGTYGYALTNGINLEGWGLVNLPNSIPATANPANGNNTALFFADQSPSNMLATGDSRTYSVTVPTASQGVPLRVTLAWTDPPGNPAAALKLVNNLGLVVTNLATGRTYYGNNFTQSDPPYSVASATNDMPVFDTVNNVENVVIPPALGTNYSVAVIGRNVTVNAVTTEQTNIAQDFALVISCDDSGNTNGISVVAATPPATAVAPPVTYIGGSSTNGINFGQLAGANAPWLSTNGIAFGAGAGFATNSQLYIGQVNQWHFYVVTNTTTYANAAFITFIPDTLSLPREGVFAGSDANATTPEADLDLFAAAEPSLLNLDPVVISNCIYGVNGDQASLSRGGTKFIVYTNSAQGNIYYIGVQCEDQMAGEYGFLAVFSQNPFSTQDTNGDIIVNGLNLPAAIPDGNNRYPGVGYVFGLAVPTDPAMTVQNVIITNTITHENFGDLLGALSHGSIATVLNNHDSLGPVINQTLVYDDAGTPTGCPGPFIRTAPVID